MKILACLTRSYDYSKLKVTASPLRQFRDAIGVELGDESIQLVLGNPLRAVYRTRCTPLAKKDERALERVLRLRERLASRIPLLSRLR